MTSGWQGGTMFQEIRPRSRFKTSDFAIYISWRGYRRTTPAQSTFWTSRGRGCHPFPPPARPLIFVAQKRVQQIPLPVDLHRVVANSRVRTFLGMSFCFRRERPFRDLNSRTRSTSIVALLAVESLGTPVLKLLYR